MPPANYSEAYVLDHKHNLGNFIKSEAFPIIRVGSSVRPFECLEQVAFLVNLGMLELSYRFQTLHVDSCKSKIRFRKFSNSIIVARISVRPF